MIDLVLTHLAHPWGPPCLKMVKMAKMAKMTIYRHGRQGSPMVAKGFQGPRGTQGMGEMSYNQCYIGHI